MLWESVEHPIPTSLSRFPSFVPPLSFFCGLIKIVLSWHYWGQRLPYAQTKTQPNPEIHSALSQAIHVNANWMLVLLKLHIIFDVCKNTKVKVLRHMCLKLMIHMSAFYYIDTHVCKFIYDEDYATAGAFDSILLSEPHQTLPGTKMCLLD